jgi:hypothetical protein
VDLCKLHVWPALCKQVDPARVHYSFINACHHIALVLILVLIIVELWAL